MHFSTAPSESGWLSVNGCSIAYAGWGEPGTLPIVLVHGAGAQMGWWDAVIDELSPRHRLVTLDLSGCGDSGWRDEYTGEQWAEEVVTVAEQIGGGPSLVVGHSLGGRVTIVAAARHPEIVLGPVLIDSHLRRPDRRPRSGRFPGGSDRRYDSLDAAVESFHLRPNEPVLDRELLLRVAANSFKPVDGQWALKADHKVYGRIDDDDLAGYLAQITSEMTFIYGDRSAVVDDDSRVFLAEAHAGPTEMVCVEGGFHHLTFDHAKQIADTVAARWSGLPEASSHAGADRPSGR
jgi:pimeloyl-ACP methyl ester carboxylesterase